jgi:hypothetical protein
MVSFASMNICWLLFLVHIANAQRYLGKVRFEDDDIKTRASLRDGIGRRRSQKYFHESTFSAFYDARYGKRSLPYYDRRNQLSALTKAYLTTMYDIGIETWLMHGSLLGWYRNGKLIPENFDIHVQVADASMQHLASYYNMSVHSVKLAGRDENRDYLLEINPNWMDASTTDVENQIDARWFDTTTGLYIDITALRWDEEAKSRGIDGRVMCKDNHRYLHNDIFPLRDGTFEDAPVKIPFAYANILVEEYGKESLDNYS